MKATIMILSRSSARSTLAALALTVCLGGLNACKAQTNTAATTQQKLSALKDLHDSGILSDDEYQQKVAALQGGQPAAAGGSAGIPSGPLVAHTLVDQAWGLPAGTVSIPRGWGFAGGVLHAAGGACTVTGTSAVMHIEAPDGSEGLVVMPSLRAQYTSDPGSMRQYASQGCLVATGMTATDFLKSVVIPKARPGARVLDSGPDPLLEQTVAQESEQMRQQMAQSGMRGALPTMTSARVRISYTRNGRPVEEFIRAMVTCMRQPLPGTPVFSVDCTADQVSLLHAPAGQLDALAARQDLVELKPNPAWQQRMAQDNQQYQQASQAQMNQQQNQNAQNANAYLQNNENAIHASAARGQQNVDMIHNIGNASMNADRQRQAAIDHSAQGTALSMSNSNIYTDPNTGRQVQMSDQYAHTYVNAEGTAVQQTNSASGPIGGGWWTEMVPSY
jgi:hypothetical protein